MKTKIIVVGTRGFPGIQGGIEKHCEELYPRLVELGCDVLVIGRAPYTGPVPYNHNGVDVLPLECPKNKFLETIVHTFIGVLKAKELKADIVHIHAIGPSLFAPLARMLGMKVVVTHHGPDYERKKWNLFAKLILRLGEQCAVLGANQMIVISKVIADEMKSKFNLNTDMIPNGVQVSERLGEEDLLKKYDLEPGKYILAVGRFVPEKGFTDLVQSFHKFSEYNRWDRWKLVIVGDADHEDSFSRDLKRRSHRIPGVVLTGFQSGKSLQELYSHAGLFVLPSSHEGLPIVLLEALSYGSSCVVSDIPANREVGLEEDRYFRVGNINALSRKLKKFLVKPVTEDERQARIAQIIEKYNWDHIARATREVYVRVNG